MNGKGRGPGRMEPLTGIRKACIAVRNGRETALKTTTTYLSQNVGWPAAYCTRKATTDEQIAALRRWHAQILELDAKVSQRLFDLSTRMERERNADKAGA